VREYELDDCEIEEVEADQNWDGACHNCGTTTLPKTMRDDRGVFWECPECKSRHDNDDNLTGYAG
jgi:ribosomal protein L37AE/L43A